MKRLNGIGLEQDPGRARPSIRRAAFLDFCGALDESNIAEVLRRTRAPEAHFAAPKVLPSGMAFRNPHVGMGGTAIEREFGTKHSRYRPVSAASHSATDRAK